MFNNLLINIEKKAILLTLAYLSKSTQISVTITKQGDEILRSYRLQNDSFKNYTFDSQSGNNCDEILTKLLVNVSREYNVVCNKITNDSDILDNFANLSNKIVTNVMEELSSTITAINSPYINLLYRLKNISDSCTLTLRTYFNISKDERTLTVLVRHLIDNIITYFMFSDGDDLLNFINGTRIITDILCLDTTLYNDSLCKSTIT